MIQKVFILVVIFLAAMIFVILSQPSELIPSRGTPITKQTWHTIKDLQRGFSLSYPDDLDFSEYRLDEDVNPPYYTGSQVMQWTKTQDISRTLTGRFEKPTFLLQIWDNDQKLSPREWYLRVANGKVKNLDIVTQDQVAIAGLTAVHYRSNQEANAYEYYFSDPAARLIFKFSVNSILLRESVTIEDLTTFYQIFSTFRFGYQ